ncbi:MAG: flagellar export chaperone FliS [Candidatus Eisenbacteria bacterium]
MERPEFQAYRRQQIAGAGPGRLLLMTYERALTACRRRDRQKARLAVTELIAALNFDYPQEAGRLLVLYEWVLRELREGKFAEAEKILGELHATWATALERLGEDHPPALDGAA